MKHINIKSKNYSIIIGKNNLKILPNKIKILCPKVRKIGIIFDKNVPKTFKTKIRKALKNYSVLIQEFKASEKNKNFNNAKILIEKFISKKFSRSDLIIAVGGGIVGDVSGFVASAVKRGINFINIPTTLLAQVDSSIGGKTGVNSKFGKNLIGAFYEPKLVLINVDFLKSLPKREMICGYAEILKHSIIKDVDFFNWLKINSKKILIDRNFKELIFSIQKSCKIKLSFTSKDLNEKKIRMILNFGHTFAHAIEAKNNYSKKINHGEAVLIGMVLATKLSLYKKICSKKTLWEITNLMNRNKINYDLKKFFKYKESLKILNFMENDKKNNDDKINFILLKRIGQTTLPGQFKMTLNQLKNVFKKII